ncbi:hypothetical protein Goari_019353 [Gossypium aridum]|uniref:Uncharacterized protein n=1 Tax=Gossypium aridum TaxID=34290 RepID=A0A7J8WTJ5_GOSAI|nr:hypothetical protein [Gossypium aridum]
MPSSEVRRRMSIEFGSMLVSSILTSGFTTFPLNRSYFKSLDVGDGKSLR